MIYLDYQATTPLAPEAREAMLQWLGGPDSETITVVTISSAVSMMTLLGSSVAR